MEQRLPAARLGSRALFPTLEARAYLGHAAISPPSELVRRKVAALVDDYARRGTAAFRTWQDDRELLRSRLAALIGSSPSDIAFVANTTRGALEVAQCLDWRRGDRVVLFEGEFPANVTPWQRAAEAHGLETRWLNADEFRSSPERAICRFEETLRAGVRLVAVSAVQFQTGHRMPLEAIGELCHAAQALLFVDAIQALGAVPVSVSAARIDFLTSGSHKWLMGLEGAGFLYVAPQKRSLLLPRTAGWLSHEGGVRFLFEGRGLLRYDRPFRSAPAFMEGATGNSVGLAALSASLEPIEALGTEHIAEYLGRYLAALETELVARDFQSLRTANPAGHSGILSAAPPNQSAIVWQRALASRGIVCSVPDGYLRFAPHWPNALDEVPLIAEALDEISHELRH